MIFAILFFCLTGSASEWQPPAGITQIALWPGRVPGARPVTGPEEVKVESTSLVAGRPWTYINRVSRPTLSYFPPKGENSGAAVVVFPGGGYQILAIDLEGTEVCDWLTAKGIACVLLKYRVPGEGQLPASGPYPKSSEALQDAQRAMGLVRQRAEEWKIDPHKIGVLGFSAGGHLVAAISTHFNRRLYSWVDAADRESCRPDFALMLYPGHLSAGKDLTKLNPAVPVTHATPPTFLVQSEDDPVDPVEYSHLYEAALRKAKVPVEMHLFAKGGHAFGLRHTAMPITDWPKLAEMWLKTEILR